MWRSVELREIRVFLTLCDELHFGRTGERLHLTSSRVSQIVRDLEAKVGAPLFVRSSRRVALTDRGAALRDELRPAVDQIDEALERVASDAIAGTLRVGELFGAGGPRFVEIIATFERRHPTCEVVVSETPWTDPLGPLLRGEIDLLSIRLPIGGRDIVTGPVLTSEPRVLAVAADHPLADREFVTLEDVADYRVGRFDFLPTELIADLIPFEAPSGRRIPRTREDIRTVAEIATQVALGRIVHPTVPAFAKRFPYPELACVAISGLPPSRTGLVWRRGNRDPRVLAFASVAEEIIGLELEPSARLVPVTGTT